MKVSEYTKHKTIFRNGSKTYFYSSLFFPAAVKADVFCLYAFVRVADDFVDSVPQNKDGFHDFCQRYYAALSGTPAHDAVIDPFVELSRRRGFDPQWTVAFLRSMEWDTCRQTYATIEDLLEYIYGSAEVIGLYMARILQLPDAAIDFAVLQGRAMQLINFVRDVAEDNELERRYLPQSETALENLSYSTAKAHPDEFVRYMRFQIDRYRDWQQQAEQGFAYIPLRYRLAVAGAADMYSWTADQIYQNPFVVYSQKVKPSKARIVSAAVWRAIARSSQGGQ